MAARHFHRCKQSRKNLRSLQPFRRWAEVASCDEPDPGRSSVDNCRRLPQHCIRTDDVRARPHVISNYSSSTDVAGKPFAESDRPSRTSTILSKLQASTQPVCRKSSHATPGDAAAFPTGLRTAFRSDAMSSILCSEKRPLHPRYQDHKRGEQQTRHQTDRSIWRPRGPHRAPRRCQGHMQEVRLRLVGGSTPDGVSPIGSIMTGSAETDLFVSPSGHFEAGFGPLPLPVHPRAEAEEVDLTPRTDKQATGHKLAFAKPAGLELHNYHE